MFNYSNCTNELNISLPLPESAVTGAAGIVYTAADSTAETPKQRQYKKAVLSQR